MNKQMTKQKYQKAEIQTYRIAFGDDDYLYSVSFKAAMDRQDLKRMLAAVRSSLYKSLPEAVRAYLDTSCLKYSDFVSGAACLEHDRTMASIGGLLHDSSCDSLSRLAGGADVYYGIMDHQHMMDKNGCEGCYYAVSRTVSRQYDTAVCHVIGQTFQCDASGGMEKSFFAIRKNGGRHRMYTLEETAGCPVLSPFGCVDMAGLLADIQSITTKEQAARIANR